MHWHLGDLPGLEQPNQVIDFGLAETEMRKSLLNSRAAFCDVVFMLNHLA